LPLSAGNLSKTPSPNEIVRKKCGSKPSDKKRQKAATNLSQYAAFCRWQFAASCRLLPSAVAHTAAVMKETSQFSVRHLPLAQLEAMTATANVALNLRNCCVKSSTQLNTIQHGSTSAVHAAEIVQPSHTQDNRKGAAKSEIS